MRGGLSPATQRVPAFVLALAIAALVGDGPAFGSPQAGAARSAAETTPPPTVALRLKETTILAPAAPNAVRAGTKCDSSGDVFLRFAYFDPVRARVDADSGVSEVIPESKRIVAYGQSPLSTTDYPNSNLRSFNVTPRGAVHALISTRRNPSDGEPRPALEYYVERFKDDGTTDSINHIEAPPGAARWFPDLLAAFGDGNLLIAGTVSGSTDPDHPSASSWRPFTAMYDPTGRFIRELTLPDDIVNDFADVKGSVQQDTKAVAPTPAANVGAPSAAADKAPSVAGAERQTPSSQVSKPREFFDVSITTGGLVSAADGNVWILRASDPLRLYAVSSAGEVVKHFQFSAPGAGLKPFEFGFAGPEQIFFEFAHFAGGPGGPSGPSRLLGVFNTVSERFETLYALPGTEKGSRFLACSDQRGGFLYLGGTPDNHLAVYDYVP